ncbi:MAG: exo-beta-N-acetylmuramidase NamZ domain-containing protein [Bacteroidales bacterium]
MVMRSIFVFFLVFTFTAISSQVKTGIDVLADNDFKELRGKRAGLITNATGVNSRLISTADILHEAPEVDLVALFAPEHGIRGDFAAGEKVESTTDRLTGIPVYSLYGATRKPSPEMLKDIDVLIYDIQDIGSRSYTYISTLGLAMEAAAESNIEMMVLDRPNPLGGNKFEGPLVEDKYISFVSQFPITYVHGFTVGELAVFLIKEGLLPKNPELTVIKMEGWKRDMVFKDTGLQWIPTSPHIPHAHSPYYYPTSGILGELYVFNIGVGYTLPFQLIAAGWVDAESLSSRLNALELPGVKFRPVHFVPYYSVSAGAMVHGVQIHITDIEKVPLSLIQFYVLQEMYLLHPGKNVFELCAESRKEMFDRVVGTGKIRTEFQKRFMVKDIIDIWNKDTESFAAKASNYFIY